MQENDKKDEKPNPMTLGATTVPENEAGEKNDPGNVIFFGDTDRPVGPETRLSNQYDKMEVRNSPLEGYGVFATADIKAGSILEEIPFVVWNRSIDISDDIMSVIQMKGFLSENEIRNDQIRSMFGFKHPKKYYFKWFPPNTPRDGDNPLYFQCLPLGYGPIYNSSNGRNNASWAVKDKTFTFQAVRDIAAGEEIQTFYGYFCSEDDQTWNTPDVFGFAMEYLVTESGNKEVFMTNIRVSSEKETALRQKEAGWPELIKCLQESRGVVKLTKISVMEGGKESHSFDFPTDFSLGYTFRKLQEFKQTRFALIKLYVSYMNPETNKEVKKEIMWVNHNVIGT